MRSSPERAKAFPESMRGSAAGFKELWRAVVVEICRDDDVLDVGCRPT
jgi:hypothetical protein